MKLTFDELLKKHDEIRSECKTREEWQTRWDETIAASGWTKTEFYDAIDEWNWYKYNC